MNESQCREVLVELGSAFPKSKPLGTMDDQIKLWMRYFRPVHIDDMIKAVTWYTEREQYFPTIREFTVALTNAADIEAPTEMCRCDGPGWYEPVKGKGMIPCPACLPETHRRWADGHMEPGHWCDDCARNARGEGKRQEVDPRNLVERPNGRTLSKEENQERLRCLQIVLTEQQEANKRDPKRHQRLSAAEKQKIWDDRLNELIAGGGQQDAEVIPIRPAFIFDDGVGEEGGASTSTLPAVVGTVQYDEDGFEIL